jgi:hypothetical protein
MTPVELSEAKHIMVSYIIPKTMFPISKAQNIHHPNPRSSKLAECHATVTEYRFTAIAA